MGNPLWPSGMVSKRLRSLGVDWYGGVVYEVGEVWIYFKTVFGYCRLVIGESILGVTVCTFSRCIYGPGIYKDTHIQQRWQIDSAYLFPNKSDKSHCRHPMLYKVSATPTWHSTVPSHIWYPLRVFVHGLNQCTSIQMFPSLLLPVPLYNS